MSLGQTPSTPDSALQDNLSTKIVNQIKSLASKFRELRSVFMLPTEQGGGVEISKHTKFIVELIQLFDEIDRFLTQSESLHTKIGNLFLQAFASVNGELESFLHLLSNAVNFQKASQNQNSELQFLSDQCSTAERKLTSLLKRFLSTQKES